MTTSPLVKVGLSRHPQARPLSTEEAAVGRLTASIIDASLSRSFSDIHSKIVVALETR